MAVFAISDVHLSFDSVKPMDIFNGWHNYTEKLKRNWENLVKNDDLVVIAGDISWSMTTKNAIKDFEFLENLPGRKIILKGNHDYWWSTIKKLEIFLEENNFKTISFLHNSAIIYKKICICGTKGWLFRSKISSDKKILNREVCRLKISLDIAKKSGLEPIVFLHYPPVYGTDESTEIINLLLENNVKKCYYGHIHGKDANKRLVLGDYKGISLNLISCDYLNFKPVLVY